MKKLAVQYDVDSSQIPIAWAVSKNIIPIIGLTKVRHAETMAKGVKVKLTTEEIETLEKIATDTGVICQASWDKSSR